MKIPISINININMGARLGSILACAFLALGAMSAQADLQDGLVGNWSFEGTLEDSAGASLPGGPAHGVGKTWSGGGKADDPDALADHEVTEPTYVTGKIGQSVKFADSFYVETPVQDDIVERFNFGAPDDPTGFTISAWITVDQFSKDWQCVVAKGEDNQWRVHRRGGATTITGNAGNGDTPEGQQDVSDGEWHHIVLRSDVEGDQGSFWVNGVMEAENSGLAPEGNIMPMMIGQNPDTGDRTWEGNIDEVAMWNRPLTDDEIAQLYNGGEGFSMGSNPSITLDFNTDPGDSFTVANTAGAPSEWRATGGMDNSGYYSITDNTNDTRNTLIFPDITDGLALRGFDFRVDLRVGGGTDSPADGFSLNLVTPEDPLLEDPVGQGFAGTMDIGGTEENLPEEGSQTGLGIGLDAWFSGGSDVIGISIRVDGVLIDQFEMPTLNGDPDDPTSLQTGPQNLDDPNDPTGLLTWQPFRAFLEPDTNKLTIEWKGEVLMDGVEVPWVPTSVIPIFAARTGGSNQNHHIDNFSLEMVPARLASLSASVRGKELIISGITGPESAFDAESLAVTLDLDGDGTQEEIDVGAGVLDGTRRVYTFEPSPSFFEPNSAHGYTVTAQDSLGNALRAEGVWEVAPTNTFAGGFFTTRHVWSAGDEIGDAETARSALAGEISLQGDITVRHPYAHFHDNAGAPIQANLSIPYPLWAEPDQMPDENIIAGERIGGGLGDRNDFAIRSTGEFFIRNGGNIHFVVNSDDGFDLLIDGESIGEAGNRARGNTVMEVELDAGTHTMELIHWERGGGAGVSLYIGRAPDLANAAVNGDNFEVLSGFNIHDVSTEDTDGDGMDDFKETFFFGDLSQDGSGDFDEDGLIDSEELALRADPTVKDSDGDGLEDGPEVHEYGTDPANVDSDGDGLADGHEVNDLGTDPTLADTDDDGFGDNVEVALGNDPLDAEDKPDAIIAVANGLWSDPATWSDGQAPGAGKNYVAVGSVTSKLVSAAGTFGGDSLTLIGPGMTLELNHSGDATANLALNNANVSVARAIDLGGQLSIAGDVHIAVGNNDLTLASQLTGSGNLTIQGGSETDFQGNVELTGAGSNFAGPLNIIGTDVAGISPGSLGTGSILLASGGVAYGYNYSSPAALLKIQGDNFRIVLGGEVTMADIVGVSPDGEVLFSLNDLAGPGPYDADLLLQAFQLDEGISGDGTVTLLGNEGDTDLDGLLDSWENEHFGNLDATADGDADEDGLSNLDEQSAGTDPNEADSDGDGLSDGDEINVHGSDPSKVDTDGDGLDDAEEVAAGTDPRKVDTDGDGIPDNEDANPTTPDFTPIVHYDFNEGSGTTIGNQGSAAGDGELTNAHAGAWVASGAPDGSGYLNFTQDGATSADSQYVATGFDASVIPIADGPYTMMAWARFDNTSPGGDSEDNMIFGQLDTGDPATVLHNGGRAGNFHMGHWGNDTNGGTIEVGEWQHVAYRFEDGNQTILVDGVEVASGSGLGGVTVASEIVIGATRGDQDRDFSGDLDDVRIYSLALPDSFIRSIAEGADGGGGGGPGPGDRPGVISAVVKADADGAVGFSFPAGTTFDVEYSIDLQTWTVIATDVTGDFQDTDVDRTAAPEGYYRGVVE